MSALRAAVAGIGAWSVDHAHWPALREALRGESTPVDASVGRRPAPLLLPPAERRRVPDGVAVALEVAREALAMASATHPIDATSLASVFASAHGDLSIVDYLCATLASDPTLLSPTRFHHSVHNAAAGYWSIATSNVGPSTSLAAGDATFALGLLDAMTQVVAEDRPVLLVAFDTPATGPLARVTPNTALFGAALLLVPVDERHDLATLTLAIEARSSTSPLPARSALHALATSSPAASAVALLERLARPDASSIDYPMDAASTLAIGVDPQGHDVHA